MQYSYIKYVKKFVKLQWLSDFLKENIELAVTTLLGREFQHGMQRLKKLFSNILVRQNGLTIHRSGRASDSRVARKWGA